MDLSDLIQNYLLKVTVLCTEDPIVMRQLSIPATINFHDLHLIIQTAFCWGQCHPYNFSIEEEQRDGKQYKELLILETDQDDNLNSGFYSLRSSTSTSLSEVLGEIQQHNKRITYEYDIDDGWKHSIEFLGRTTESTETAVCVSGAGHPCAEDVGGPTGWEEIKRAYENLFDKSDIRANKRRQWYKNDCINGDREGLASDGPYRWDREAVNKELARLKFGQYVEDEVEV